MQDIILIQLHFCTQRLFIHEGAMRLSKLIGHTECCTSLIVPKCFNPFAQVKSAEQEGILGENAQHHISRVSLG